MKLFSQMGIKGKLICGILAFIFISAGISAYGIIGLTKVGSTYEHVASINLPNSEALSGMLNDQKDIASLTNRYSLMAENSPEAEKLLKDLEENIAHYEKVDKWYQDIPFVEGEDALYQPVSAGWKSFKAAVEKIIATKKADGKVAHSETVAMFELSNSFEKTITELVKFQGSQAKTWRDSAASVSKNTLMMQIILSCASAIIYLLLGIWFANALASKLNTVVESISNSSHQVGAAAEQIATASQSLSQATTEQAASLQETSAAIEETSAMVNKNSDNAKSAATNSAECQDKAEKGQMVVEKMIQSMDQINESNNNIMTQINSSNNQISEIVKVIQEIGNKTKVINEIVFQTKLLSFNASVEAARAGENGKGFAVVAEEVGNLAQMSGNASKEITTLLEGSIHKVESIVNETKSKVETLIADGRDKVATGIDIARQCGDVLNEIVQNVSKVTNMAKEISAACQDQSIGVVEITKAVNQLDQVTQINASNSEETAHAAESLSSQTVTLNEAIGSLVSTIKGGASNLTTMHERKSAPVNNRMVASTSNKKGNTANVVPFAKTKSTKANTTSTAHPAVTYKATAGDAVAPSHTHPGFKDV